MPPSLVRGRGAGQRWQSAPAADIDMLCTYVVRRWLRLSAARQVVKLTPQQVSGEALPAAGQ